MDIEQKHQILNGAAFNELYVGGWITTQVLTDLRHQQSISVLVCSFKIYFFKAVNTLIPLYGPVNANQRSALDIVFMGTRMLDKKPDEFINSFMLNDFANSPEAKGYKAVFQSAFIYAVASAYGSQIKHIFMRATNEWLPSEREKLEMMMSGTINGMYLYGSKSHAAQFSDNDYVQYMQNANPILANFVRLKNRFKHKQILAVMGYLINPDLGAGSDD